MLSLVACRYLFRLMRRCLCVCLCVCGHHVNDAAAASNTTIFNRIELLIQHQLGKEFRVFFLWYRLPTTCLFNNSCGFMTYPTKTFRSEHNLSRWNSNFVRRIHFPWHKLFSQPTTFLIVMPFSFASNINIPVHEMANTSKGHFLER